uniref:Uncharacterized protein n=1 Tax=Salmo trutta TaxID=8032 RepID=A0A674EJE3_SALTR
LSVCDIFRVSSRPQAVVVWPLSPSIPPSILPPSACSQQVLVSARPLSAPLYTNQGASIIRGQDSVTGHTLRCDVIVDQIKQIQVVTTTRQLFTEDPPLVLSVVALDSGGNTFSSLAGLQFDWRLVKDSETAEIVSIPCTQAYQKTLLPTCLAVLCLWWSQVT